MENQRSFLFLILRLNKIRYVYYLFYTLQVYTTGKRIQNNHYFHRIYIAAIAGLHFRVASNVEKSSQMIVMKFA